MTGTDLEFRVSVIHVLISVYVLCMYNLHTQI